MALQTIKNIINNKGVVINPKDRAIFETGDLRSFFGLSQSDAIEFIVYDINDNQLPQGEVNELVRYIPLTTENISDYILIPEGTILQKYSLPNEYFIDVERLLKEAGYTDGIYKTQITLVNKRIGSEKESDKLYINEISPSRTEVRVFPVLKSSSDAVKANLKERFGIFINDGTFRDDVISLAIPYIEKIDVTKISTIITSTYGEAWLTNFIKEYKVQDFDVFLTTIYNIFIQSCVYEFTDKISDINSVLYGKQKGIQSSLALNIEDVRGIINRILIESMNKFVIIPETRDTRRDIENVESKDDIEKVLVRKTSDLTINAQAPIRQITEIKKTITDKQLVFDQKVKKQLPEISKSDRPKPEEKVEAPAVVEVIDETSGVVVEEVVVTTPKPVEEERVVEVVDVVERVDIPNFIDIGEQRFEITPLPLDIVGGSPVGGEGEQANQGSPSIGERTQRGGILGGAETSNPQDAIQNEYRFRDRVKKREL